MNDASNAIPEITDDDVAWIADLMRLKSIDEPRRQFLMSRTTLDVSACPGSGKTTLIVAKLAILARKWPHRSRGVCVISHTNVAREEIEHRLGNTDVGQALLSYPHFVGTIHAFVNHFLAIPWLRSQGFPLVVIDDEAATSYRRRILGRDFRTIKSALERKHLNFDQLRVCGRDFSFDLNGEPFPFGSHTPSYKLAAKAVQASAKAGYFCHDEMFVWARAMLDDFPKVADWLSHRFPLVLIDEMQDTSEQQASVLDLVFPRQSPRLVIQRVGDPNQAIFNSDNAFGSTGGPTRNRETKGTPFPDPTRHLEISSSFRFGPDIANIASSFAVAEVMPNGLVGQGPRVKCPTQGPGAHAVFVFPDDSTEGVLDAFGQHVLATVPESLLKNGLVTAVGAVHRLDSNVAPEEKSYPKSVGHYWSKYAPEVSSKDPIPSSLAGYFITAQAMAATNQDLASAVDKVASGLIRYANLVGDTGSMKKSLGPHRSLLEAISNCSDAVQLYRKLLRFLLVDRTELCHTSFSRMKPDIIQIIRPICVGDMDLDQGENFVTWPQKSIQPYHSPGTGAAEPPPNIYRVTKEGKHVDIHLGSIHSVKGQTHVATLILDTYYRTHFFGKLFPWLAGKKSFGNGNPSDEKRLREAYVAMTRPTHVLCLAMRHSSVGKDRNYERNIALLQARGWRIAELKDGTPVWRK